MVTQPFNIQRWSNNAQTNLDGGVVASDTTMDVVDASDFPTSGSFWVLIDNENVEIESVSGNTFNLVGQFATGHTSGKSVSLMQSNETIEQAYRDAFTETTYPYNRILDQGNTRTASSFTWFNQGSATLIDSDDDSLLLTLPSEANWQWRGKHRTAPATPWKIYAFVLMGPGCSIGSSGSSAGIIARESSTGKLYVCGNRDDELCLWKFTNNTTFLARVGTQIDNQRQGVWMSLEDDGVDITAGFSVDGVNWIENWSEGRTVHMAGGPDQIGFAGTSGSGKAGMHIYFKTWIVE